MTQKNQTKRYKKNMNMIMLIKKSSIVFSFVSYVNKQKLFWAKAKQQKKEKTIGTPQNVYPYSFILSEFQTIKINVSWPLGAT